MLKRFSRFLLLILLVMFIVSSSSLICFADEVDDHEHEHSSTEGLTEEEIHSGDLYVFDNTIVMDKYVDGNVFLFGNNIEITGKVNGNLFVLGNNVKFNESIVRYSIFVCANSVYYNGGCGTSSDYGNLYIAASNFESTYNSYVTGDIKSVASSVILKSAVYRDVDLICRNVNFGEGEDIPVIYGNLNYASNREVNIPEGVIGGEGNVNYTSTYNLKDILIGFGTCIVTILSLYMILNKLTPKFIEKVYNNKFSILSILKAFGIGLATTAIVAIFIILLAGTIVGVSLSIILTLLFTILCIIATPLLIIKITNILKETLKIEKTAIFYLVISLVSIVFYGINLIPLVGIILGLAINTTALGLIITIYLPHKEITEEEKLALEEVKKQSKENKEKRKEEKRKTKNAKKEEKLKTNKKNKGN